jgi:hypothetical protein
MTNKLLLLASSALALMAPQAVSAQNTSTPAATAAEPSVEGLGDIVVTARRNCSVRRPPCR